MWALLRICSRSLEKEKKISSIPGLPSFAFHFLWCLFENKRFHSQTTAKTQVILNQLNYRVYNFFLALILSCRCSVHYSMIICICIEQNILESFLLHLVIFLAGFWSSFISCHSLIQSANLSCNCLEPFLSSREITEVCNLSLPYCNCKNSSEQNKPYLTDSHFVTLWLQSIQKWHSVH